MATGFAFCNVSQVLFARSYDERHPGQLKKAALKRQRKGSCRSPSCMSHPQDLLDLDLDTVPLLAAQNLFNVNRLQIRCVAKVVLIALKGRADQDHETSNHGDHHN